MAKPKKAKVDNSNYLKRTGHKLKDRVYNWIVNRYEKKGHQWRASDTIIWYGSIYEMPTIIGYIVQVALFWLLANLAIKRYGDPAYGIMMLLILMLWRIGMLMKQTTTAREELEKLNRKF